MVGIAVLVQVVMQRKGIVRDQRNERVSTVDLTDLEKT